VKRAIREHRGDFLALLALLTVAAIVGGYILENQRLRFPIIEPEPFELKGTFETAQAVTPGQGQTVRVAGVRIGDIAKAELKDGRAVITMEIDRKYDDLVRENATALLRPKTGLKDMFIELNPGTKDAPLAKEGFNLPIANTLPDVNPDEFFASLDTDTRDYLKLLLQGARKGLENNGDDLREVLKRFEPTYRDLAAVSTEVKSRRVELRRLINSLQRLNTELGSRDDDLAQLVDSSQRVFRAFANERTNVSATVAELPGALQELETNLAKVRRMATVLRPAADQIRPAVRALNRSNSATAPFAREAAPLIERDIRPFVREARPLIRDLNPAAKDLVDGEPGLKRTFKVLNHFFNMLAHNPGGRQGPEVNGRDEGYLFYLAWVGHQTNNLFNNADAHGPGRPFTSGGTCSTLEQTVQSQPQLEAILGLSGAFSDPRVCGGASPGGGLLPTLPTVPTPTSRKADR
jgi:phospholipid/cholesterol/gamma-HCH transport system substrate-binding protein